jgi:sigma-B regulation protein RsbU (phosphoserine phosphatase)
LGNTAITAIENLRLFREELEKKKIDSEIKIALEIQKNLLPKSDPIIEGIDIAGITLASRYVGGDYYDYLKINEDIYFIIIADVTGKGIPASILMANIQSAVKLLCYTDNEPAIIAVKLNKLVCSNTTIDKFASVFMGFLNIKEKSLQFVNAGHNPPFIYNKFNDEVQFLSTENMLIGVLENNIYNSKKVFFKSGDILVMYTDGVVEAQYNNQEFSEEKLINLVKNNSDASAKEIINTFLAEINFRPDNTNLYDDVTKIIMKF